MTENLKIEYNSPAKGKKNIIDILLIIIDICAYLFSITYIITVIGLLINGRTKIHEAFIATPIILFVPVLLNFLFFKRRNKIKRVTDAIVSGNNATVGMLAKELNMNVHNTVKILKTYILIRRVLGVKVEEDKQDKKETENVQNVVVSCPSCGASISVNPKNPVCEYCGSKVQVAK